MCSDLVYVILFPQLLMVVHFKDQRVVKIEGDELPQGGDGSDPFLPGYKGPQNKGAQK